MAPTYKDQIGKMKITRKPILERLRKGTRNKKSLVAALRKVLRATNKLSILTSNEEPSLTVSKTFSTMPDEIRSELDKIPTQTTRHEREFLYNFF